MTDGVDMGIVGIVAVYWLVLFGGLVTATALSARGRWRAASLAQGICVVLLVAWYHATKLDSVAALFYPEDTVYAPGFSEDAFHRVTPGQSEGAVLSQLGPPLDCKVVAGREYWYYSRPGPRFQNYWNRIVILDTRTRRVVRVFREFYRD